MTNHHQATAVNTRQAEQFQYRQVVFPAEERPARFNVRLTEAQRWDNKYHNNNDQTFLCRSSVDNSTVSDKADYLWSDRG